MAYALHVSCKLFLITLLNAILCYLNPTDLSSTALKAWEESICRDYPAAWQLASVFQCCFRLFARPTLSKKPIMNVGSKGSAENHVLFLLEGKESPLKIIARGCAYTYI